MSLLGKLFIDKFPTFDPTWSDEVKSKWFDAFNQLNSAYLDRKPFTIPYRGVPVVCDTPADVLDFLDSLPTVKQPDVVRGSPIDETSIPVDLEGDPS